MASGIVGGGRVRRAWRAAWAVAAAVVILGGCSTHRYAGVDLRPGAAPIEVQDLARMAMGGSKQAQFDLGIRLEEGRGVPVDRDQAARLFKRAAADSGGTVWIYSPSPGNGAPARVLPVERPRQAGLPAAAARLRIIRDAER